MKSKGFFPCPIMDERDCCLMISGMKPTIICLLKCSGWGQQAYFNWDPKSQQISKVGEKRSKFVWGTMFFHLGYILLQTVFTLSPRFPISESPGAFALISMSIVCLFMRWELEPDIKAIQRLNRMLAQKPKLARKHSMSIYIKFIIPITDRFIQVRARRRT